MKQDPVSSSKIAEDRTGKALTCGAEEKDIRISKELIHLVGDVCLSICDRAEAIFIFFT